MLKSEFWNALDQIYGPALGRSLFQDLYLVPLKMSGREAMDAGVDVEVIWDALVDETGKGEEARWVHRRPKKKRSRRAERLPARELTGEAAHVCDISVSFHNRTRVPLLYPQVARFAPAFHRLLATNPKCLWSGISSLMHPGEGTAFRDQD